VKVPDLLDDSALYDWAGISLGRSDLYRLFLSIKKLAESLSGDVERLRWVGRISTRSRPYFIVEGVNPEEEEGVDESKQEGKAGANKYAYWVTQSLEQAQWTKLPNVTMEQVVKVRLFKRLFTGNLDADVPSYPPFPGSERHLLRAILACIVGETSISPDGFFDLDEEDPPSAKPADAEAMNERFPKASDELKEPDNWKHHEVELNKLGRVLAMPEQLDENGEPIVPDDPVEPNPPLDSIKPEQWTFRLCPGGAGSSSMSAVVARSLRWPGAVAVAAGRKYINVYVGNGLPYSSTPYSPTLPAPIQTEWAPPQTDGEAAPGLVEQPDVKVDPTPPVAEGEAEEE
jgi:radial spoke head protein 4/6